MDATYTNGYAKMIKKTQGARPAITVKPKKIQRSMNDFFSKKVKYTCAS